jgi:hypothetical protein
VTWARWLPVVPVAAWIGVEAVWGAGPALWVGGGLAAVEVGWQTWREGRPDRLGLMSLALIVGLGGLALWEDAGWARLAPAVGDVVMAGVVVWSLRGGGSLLADLAARARPEEPLDAWDRGKLRAVTWRFAAVLLVHAAMVVAMRDLPWAEPVGGTGGLVLMGAWMALEASWTWWGPAPPPRAAVEGPEAPPGTSGPGFGG